MTSLLTRPDTARADAARPRPLVLIATLGGVLAALGPLVVLLAVGVIGWFITDAGVHGAPRDGMRVAALAWLAGHGSGFTVMGARISLVPLGLTAVSAWSMWRLGHRVGDAVSGHGPDADRISDGERDFTVPTAILTFFAGYAVVAVVVATLAAGSTADPSVPRVLVWTILMTAFVAAPAIAIGSGRAAIWTAFMPATVRAGAAVAGAVIGTLLVVSALVFVVALGLSFDDAATMTSQLHPSPSEAGLYALVNAAFVPNAVLFTGSFLLGPGFAVGGATLVSPGAVVLGPLPVVPLLAALPAAGTPAGWVGALMLLPPIAAAVAAVRVLRRRPLTWDRIALAGCGGGIVAGLGLTVLTSLSGGSAGPGRMRFVGPFTRDVLVHSVTACGIGALLGASVLALLAWRSARTWAETPGDEAAED
ncbi:cell division protein PerM [Nocardia sp. N13]|uniref:cell division protein PerM n=1 Tax=Nocardioides sp. N13(2025) TaxID=3453405 RepID=UPI003F766ED7